MLCKTYKWYFGLSFEKVHNFFCTIYIRFTGFRRNNFPIDFESFMNDIILHDVLHSGRLDWVAICLNDWGLTMEIIILCTRIPRVDVGLSWWKRQSRHIVGERTDSVLSELCRLNRDGQRDMRRTLRGTGLHWSCLLQENASVRGEQPRVESM